MNVLIVAAHPDDEIIGAGGVACLHSLKGDHVHVLILSQGVTSRDNYGHQKIADLRGQTRQASKIIGFTTLEIEDFPDNQFDSLPLLQVVKTVEKYLLEWKPRAVYTHHGGDLNIDHQICYQAVLTSCRPCNPNCPDKLLTFETLSSTEWQGTTTSPFLPNHYVDISSVLDRKIKAMQAYKSEICEYPHPRSEKGIQILAQYRGLESGFRYAEAFQLIRELKQFSP